MLFSTSALATLAIAFVQRAAGVGPTDSYGDADTAQSGYLPNHNMDPAVVDSSQFGQLWKVQFNPQEQVSQSRLLLLLKMAVFFCKKRGCTDQEIMTTHIVPDACPAPFCMGATPPTCP